MNDNQKRDQAKYYLEVPDADFSPERNKKVVEDSIKKYEIMRRKKWNERLEEYRERADATVQYLRAIDRGKEANLPKYFGRKMLAHFRGDEILFDIRQLMKNAKAQQKIQNS